MCPTSAAEDNVILVLVASRPQGPLSFFQKEQTFVNTTVNDTGDKIVSRSGITKKPKNVYRCQYEKNV
jgi:hypothetical protein